MVDALQLVANGDGQSVVSAQSIGGSGGKGGLNIAGGITGNGVCRQTVAGGPCRTQIDCLETEYCRMTGPRAGTCTPYAPEGAACQGLQCATGLVCVGTGSTARCRRTALVGESCVDAPCEHDIECSGGVCRIYGLPGGLCSPRPLEAGGQCWLGRCDQDAGVCVRPGLTGPCSRDAECVSGRCRRGQCEPVCQ